MYLRTHVFSKELRQRFEDFFEAEAYSEAMKATQGHSVREIQNALLSVVHKRELFWYLAHEEAKIQNHEKAAVDTRGNSLKILSAD